MGVGNIGNSGNIQSLPSGGDDFYTLLAKFNEAYNKIHKPNLSPDEKTQILNKAADLYLQTISAAVSPEDLPVLKDAIRHYAHGVKTGNYEERDAAGSIIRARLPNGPRDILMDSELLAVVIQKLG